MKLFLSSNSTGFQTTQQVYKELLESKVSSMPVKDFFELVFKAARLHAATDSPLIWAWLILNKVIKRQVELHSTNEIDKRIVSSLLKSDKHFGVRYKAYYGYMNSKKLHKHVPQELKDKL
jgi:hypothetical protein